MSDTVNHIKTLYTECKNYVETSVELYKLSAVDKIADVLSSLFSKVILALIAFTFIVFFNLAIAFLISEKLGSYSQGFLIVSMFYLVIAIVAYIFRKSLVQNPIANSIIVKMMSNGSKEDEIQKIIDNEQGLNGAKI